MAVYNEILAGRFARALQKMFSMKGEVPMKQLAGDLQAVHPFFSGAENRTLEGWDRFGSSIQFGASAGNVSMFQLNNPPGSNIIAVFEKLSISSGGPDTFIMNSATGNPAALTTPYSLAATRWDSRGKLNPVITASQQQTAFADLATPRLANLMLSSTNLEVIATDIQEFALLPGDALRIRNASVNVAVDINFWWRERSLEESERTA